MVVVAVVQTRGSCGSDFELQVSRSTFRLRRQTNSTECNNLSDCGPLLHLSPPLTV